MKRILTGVLVIALTITFSVIALASNGEKTATPSQTKFIMDGKEVTFDVAYNIENSNYIQLRNVRDTTDVGDCSANLCRSRIIGQINHTIWLNPR